MPRPAAPTFADACERLLRAPDGEHSVYTTLAPLFDRLTSEGRVAGEFEAVQAFAPESGRALELGCGVGALLSHLSDRYDRTLGIEAHPALLRFTAHRAPQAGVAAGDPVNPPTAAQFDAVISMAGPAAQHGDPKALIDTAFEHLAPGGTLLLRAVTGKEQVRAGSDPIGVFSGSGYRLERSVTELPSDDGLELQMGYRVTDEASGERATTRETVSVSFSDPESLRTHASDAGLDDVRLLDGDGTTLLVAHAP